VIASYENLAAEHPERILVLDATLRVNDLAELIKTDINRVLSRGRNTESVRL